MVMANARFSLLPSLSHLLLIFCGPRTVITSHFQFAKSSTEILDVKNPGDTLEVDVLAFLDQEILPGVTALSQDGVLPPGEPLDVRHVALLALPGHGVKG